MFAKQKKTPAKGSSKQQKATIFAVNSKEGFNKSKQLCDGANNLGLNTQQSYQSHLHLHQKHQSSYYQQGKKAEISRQQKQKSEQTRKNPTLEQAMRSDLFNFIQQNCTIEQRPFLQFSYSKQIINLSREQVYSKIKDLLINKAQRDFRTQYQQQMLNLRQKNLKLNEQNDYLKMDQNNRKNQETKQSYWKQNYLKQQTNSNNLNQQINQVNNQIARLIIQNNGLKQTIVFLQKKHQSSERLKLTLEEEENKEDQIIHNLKVQLSHQQIVNQKLNKSITQMKMIKKQLKGQYDQLQAKLNEEISNRLRIAKEYQNLKHQCRNKRQKNQEDNFNKLLQSYETLKYQYSIQEQSSEGQRRNNLKIKRQFQQNLRQKQKEINNIKAQLQSKDATMSALSTQNSKLNLQISQKRSIVLELQRSIITKDKDIQQLKAKEKELNEQIASLNDILLRSEEKTKLLHANIITINEQKNTIDSNLKTKMKQIQQLTSTTESLKKLLQETSNHRNLYNQAESKKQSRIKQLENNLSNLISKIDEDTRTITTLESELKNEKTKKQQNNSLIFTIQQLQLQNKQLQNSLSHIKESKINEENRDNARINSLYQHQLLQHYYDHKQFLTEGIEDRYNLRIKKTKLIYTFDPISKTNFHQYIDNVSNIVIIIKTVTAMFLAAYSQGCFAPKKLSDKDGMIISLSNKRIFTPSEPNKKAITYDDYYIIFGNSEIRLKSLEKKVFSNFGINSCYYNTKGEKVSILLGGGPQEREVDIQSYEIYQIFFHDY